MMVVVVKGRNKTMALSIMYDTHLWLVYAPRGQWWRKEARSAVLSILCLNKQLSRRTSTMSLLGIGTNISVPRVRTDPTDPYSLEGRIFRTPCTYKSHAVSRGAERASLE